MSDSILDQLSLESGAISPLLDLFGNLPDILFWIKNHKTEILWVNHAVAEHLEISEDEIIGKTDLELYPREWALKYQKDDLRVIENGERIEGEIELLINKLGLPVWRKITKLPIFDKNEKIIGTTGLSAPYENAAGELPDQFSQLSKIIQHAREGLKNQISVSDLAQFAGMSEATLNRRFQDTLHLSPHELIGQLRVTTACELLRSSMLNISEISMQCGYNSPAAFSRAFKKLKQMSPRDYRIARS